MFCKNCGKQLDDSTKFCPGCGTPVEVGSIGSTAQPVVNSNVGGTVTLSEEGISDKSRKTAALLCAFFGSFGVHDFYLGKTVSGIIQIILSCFVVGLIWPFIDLIIILCGEAKDGTGRKVVNWSSQSGNSTYVIDTSDDGITSKKSRGIATLLCGFFGYIGLHYFYLGRKGLAIAQIIASCFGVGFIWALVDFIVILCGAEKDSDGKKVTNWSIHPYAEKIEVKQGSYFDGTVSQRIMWILLAAVIDTITFGWGFSITYCWIKSWQTHHTVINGRRLRYVGKPGKLFVMCLIAVLLTIVTFGIYAFYFPIKLIKWDEQHTFFEDEIPENEALVEDKNNKISFFDGGFWQLFGWSCVVDLIYIFTFGLGLPWALVLITKWQTKHTVYNGKRLVFEGKGSDLFVKWLIWGLLFCVTCGIYGFWIPIKLIKWSAENTFIEGDERTINEQEEEKTTTITPLMGLGIAALACTGINFLYGLINYIVSAIRHSSSIIYRLDTIFVLIFELLFIASIILMMFCNKDIVKRISISVVVVAAAVCLFKSLSNIIRSFVYMSNLHSSFRLGILILLSLLLLVGAACGIAYAILHVIKNKPTKIELFSLIGSIVFVAVLCVPGMIIKANNKNEYKKEEIRREKEEKELAEKEAAELAERQKLEEERAEYIEKESDKHNSYPQFEYDSSSYLVEKLSSGTFEYKATNLSSHNDNYPWVPANCSSTKGIGEKIILKAQADSHLLLNIYNGYRDENHPDYYEKNSRAKKIKATVLETGYSKILELRDSKDEQTFNISNLFEEESSDICTIELEVLDVYDGSKYKDLCIDAIQYEFERFY